MIQRLIQWFKNIVFQKRQERILYDTRNDFYKQRAPQEPQGEDPAGAAVGEEKLVAHDEAAGNLKIPIGTMEETIRKGAISFKEYRVVSGREIWYVTRVQLAQATSFFFNTKISLSKKAQRISRR